VWTALAVFLNVSLAFQTLPDIRQENAITAALERFNARDYNPFIYRELGRTLDAAGGGVVYLALESRTSGERIPDIVEWLVVVPQGDAWLALLPGDFGYTDALTGLRHNLRLRLDDTAFRIPRVPGLVPAAELLAYDLPWEDGRWAAVTRSYRQHGRGRIDFDLTSGTVTAAKDGVIVYANDSSSANGYSTGAWWYWNTVIIEHGEHEYSLYGHLAPGSVPQSIRDGCATNYAQSNCHVPVHAGDVIGMQGSTGYSFAPHLHVEFGQSYGVVGYATGPTTIAYAGYIYAEQNVGLSGYSAQEVASWRYGRLMQALHNPAPDEIELVHNGSFDADTSAWSPSGQVSWDVQDGVMRFLRLNTAEPPAWASFYQDFGYGTPANAVFELRFGLGNDAPAAKTVSVTLRNSAGYEYGALTCDFTIPAHTPLQPYSMRAQADDTWANIRLEFAVNPPDSAPAALVDDISARLVPFAGTLRTLCNPPPQD
jgi:murein DD-endopeptidase MepM/ murein hydrolase activator NlpD